MLMTDKNVHDDSRNHAHIRKRLVCVCVCVGLGDIWADFICAARRLSSSAIIYAKENKYWKDRLFASDTFVPSLGEYMRTAKIINL